MWSITVAVKDSESKLSSVAFYMPPETAYADVLSEADTLADLVGALTDGVVQGWTLSQTSVRSTAIPAGNVDNEIKASFGFTHAAGGTARVSIPAFDRTKLIPNSDQVNRADADVLAFTNALILSDFADYRGADLVALKYAVEAYTARQK